ncbi:MAG: adenylate/guanylate cyclase domain-containing protein [Bacteroidota bacterium]
MKKIFLWITLFIFFQIQSFSQNQHLLDSLAVILKTANEDTSKVNILIALSIQFKNIDPDRSVYFANKALSLAKKLNYENGIADAELASAGAIVNLGKYDIALQNCHDALKIYEHLPETVNAASKLKNQLQISSAYNVIGIIYTIYGNYPTALKNLFTALSIREKTNDRIGISYTENNLGIIYYNQGNYPAALNHYFVSLKIREEFGDKAGISSSYGNIGIIYFLEGNYSEALKNYLASLKLAEEIGNKQLIASCYINIGDVKNNQNEYTEALKYNFAALKINEETGNKETLNLSYNNIGSIYRKQKSYREATNYLNKSLLLAKEIGSLEMIKEGYKEFAELDSAQNNQKQSLADYKLYISYRDSIFNKENTKKIVESQMQYDFDKKEAATKAEQDKKDITQRNIRNLIVSGLAGALIFLIVVYRQRNKISKEKKRSEELLLNILPAETAEELKKTGTTKAKDFSEVTVLFTDFKNFTLMSEKLSAQALVNEINYCYSAFDNIITKHGIEKIKTIGDSYMCAGGLPVANKTNAEDTVRAALEIRDFMQNERQKRESEGKTFFEIRIGCNTGSVVAGIVGIKKFAYDIWGDTVNIASRMESSGEAGKVNISGSTYELVKAKFKCEHRGKIQAKNKGEIDMYFVESKN